MVIKKCNTDKPNKSEIEVYLDIKPHINKGKGRGGVNESDLREVSVFVHT